MKIKTIRHDEWFFMLKSVVDIFVFLCFKNLDFTHHAFYITRLRGLYRTTLRKRT